MNVSFTGNAWTEYLFWQSTDRKILNRINSLVRDVTRDPFGGIGKPEPLRNEWSGWWSRRIDDAHRLIYRVDGDTVVIAQCRYHY